ncbi:MAG TPA: alkaline phosphatase family protein [Candidatus Baltobacteraceae bacterium]|nr:alkaline phosphatase family protein [Candidatus Baltobacteraceae bacterium]
MNVKMCALLVLVGLAGAMPRQAAAAVAPHASYVTIVMMENRDYASVVGSPQAPYFNKKLVPQGVLLENSHAVTHPSEPNYLALFSGSTQGLTSDACPVSYASANLASRLAAAGKTFIGWAESMPRDGFTGCYSDDIYARKHDPWVDFTNVPASANRVYKGLPAPRMADVNWVTPNLCNDMHDCSTSRGDRWLSENLPRIIAWDARNNGLLIVTWDEAAPDLFGANRIPTVLVGPMIQPGARNRQKIDHYGVLHTIESIFGLPCIAKDCSAPVIGGIWR